jgi:hypothetical protein
MNPRPSKAIAKGEEASAVAPSDEGQTGCPSDAATLTDTDCPHGLSLFHGGRQQKRTLRNKRRYLEYMARAIYDAGFRGSL